MNEIYSVISGVSAVGLLLLILWLIRVKSVIKKELVDPEIESLRKDFTAKVETLKENVDALKKNDAELSNKLDRKLDSVKQSLAETNQSIAKMQGSLDLLITQLTK